LGKGLQLLLDLAFPHFSRPIAGLGPCNGNRPTPAVVKLQAECLATNGPIPADFKELAPFLRLEKKFPETKVLLSLRLQSVRRTGTVMQSFSSLFMGPPGNRGEEGINQSFPKPSGIHSGYLRLEILRVSA